MVAHCWVHCFARKVGLEESCDDIQHIELRREGKGTVSEQGSKGGKAPAPGPPHLVLLSLVPHIVWRQVSSDVHPVKLHPQTHRGRVNRTGHSATTLTETMCIS